MAETPAATAAQALTIIDISIAPVIAIDVPAGIPVDVPAGVSVGVSTDGVKVRVTLISIYIRRSALKVLDSAKILNTLSILSIFI